MWNWLKRLFRRPAPAPPATPATWAARLLTAAGGEVGVKEVGNNGGERIREYQSATWLEPGSWPWCAVFICWCVRASAAPIPGITLPRTAGAWDFEEWARGKYGSVPGVELLKPHSGDIAPGDICVYTFSHIGIVVRRSGKYAHTIEGNTNPGGAREGDGVYRKRRPINKIRSIIRLPE